MCWRQVKARWLNNTQTQWHMQPTPLLSKSLKEHTCTRSRNHDGNIYRLVSAFDCRLNVAGTHWDTLSITAFRRKVQWASGKLHPSASATTTTKFFRWIQAFKAAWKSTKIYPRIFQVCFLESQYIPRKPRYGRHPVLLQVKKLKFFTKFH